MQKTPRWACAALSIFAASCGPNQWSGTVQGQPLVVRRALWSVYESSAFDILEFTSTDESCAELVTFPPPPMAWLSLQGVSDPPTIVAGTYDVLSRAELSNGVDSHMTVNGYFLQPDGGQSSLTEGVLRLDEYNSGADGGLAFARGSFDFRFNADAVTGTFDATVCRL